MKNRSSSELFLTELLLSILIFAVSGGICVRLFAQAGQISRQTARQNAAVTCTSSAVALLQAGNGSFDELRAAFPLGEASETAFTIFYDGRWQACAAADALYCLNLQCSYHADRLMSVRITVNEINTSREPIYTLEYSLHVPFTPKEAAS